METVALEVADGVAWVTLDRPEVMNAFDARMQDELSETWRRLRADDDVRVVVLTGAGDRAFCTGIDRSGIAGDGTAEGGVGFAGSPFHLDDPGAKLGPKSNDFWKPVIAAVNGIACGGAFYLLGECDILIAAETATFFDVPRTKSWVILRRLTHSAHHRAQLTVYLRLLGRALYSTYGPTADTGGLFQNKAPVVYRYASVEELLAAEEEGGHFPPLPGPGDKSPTERP